MAELIDKVVDIIGDYHQDVDSGFVMNHDHVLEWVSQFDETDQEFILTELLHLLNQDIYVSKGKAKEILYNFIIKITTHFEYLNVESFLRDTVFLRLQPKGKSQDVLLNLLDEVLQERFGTSLGICGTFSKRNFIYLDDILATGKTFRLNMITFFEQNDYLQNLKEKKIRFLAYFFCVHSWGLNNVRYSLNKDLKDNFFMDEKLFLVKGKYIIENNIKANKQKLNLVYPQIQNDLFDEYLGTLNLDNTDKSRAYRNPGQPDVEVFFTSSQNRNRLEAIFTQKGIDIINQIRDDSLKINHRPLGKTYPHYKTFGTGTMYFTWRNISNTCPIVFWWDNPAHNWKGLFPLYKRGIK